MPQTSSINKILFHLKTSGPQTAKNLASILCMSSMGARQHLQELESQGKVCTFEESTGVGRPKLYWKLTKEADQHFPDTHAFLSVEIIHSIKNALGENALEKIILDREQKTLKQYKEAFCDCRTLEEKIGKLAQIRESEGYMAKYEKLDDGHYMFYEQHCPICVAAQTCNGFCRSELNIFKKLLGQNVSIERMEHILAGDLRCAYIIQKHL